MNTLKTNYWLLLLFSFLLFSCNQDAPKTDEPATPTPTEAAAPNPVPFPNVGIPDFEFPTPETTIDGWVTTNNMTEIYKHGWGIWAGLTAPSGEGDYLVFETWLTPDEIIAEIKGEPIDRDNRPNLSKPNQLLRAAPAEDVSISESVVYSPAAANYAIENKIFLATTLALYLKEGMTDIPAFPYNAITTKPVFKLITKDKLNEQGLYSFPTWYEPTKEKVAYPERDWGYKVYVDPDNGGKGNGQVAKKDAAATPETTYNLTDFIHYKLSEEDAEYYNKEFGLKAKPGDIAILVAMHVTSRETTRWTWQSYFWTADADKPFAPSSEEIAQLRPMEYLNGAAKHYAMTVAYSMIDPAQPFRGGKNVGTPIFAFNPYLEAGFDESVFEGSHSYVMNNKGVKIATDVGIRTNCMSCHVYAAWSTDTLSTFYSGDTYVDLDESVFKGMIRTDFAWSVADNVDTTGLAAFLRE